MALILKNHYFDILNSNIYQSAAETILPFDVRIDEMVIL